MIVCFSSSRSDQASFLLRVLLVSASIVLNSTSWGQMYQRAKMLWIR